MAIEMIETEGCNQGACIKVIGVGGGGGNAVQHMIESQVRGVEFICANTDAQALLHSRAEGQIQLGTTGLGAGSKPEKGREAAQMAEDEIRQSIAGAHMLFITAGMGGGTGTGAATVIVRIAKELGVLTVGVVTKPFEFEGSKRMSNADEGLRELEANVDSLIVVLNDKLLEVYGEDITQDEAFSHANNVLRNAVGGIAEIINVPGNVNVDFEDVRTVMGEPGKAMMGTAMASGPDRARIAAEQAVACPLLDGINLSGARGVLVLISSSKGSLKLKESSVAMETIRAYASPDAHVIYGTAYDDNLGDALRITVVATGLNRQGAKTAMPPIRVLRTGTDDPMPFAPGMPVAAGMGTASASVSPASTGAASAAPYGDLPANAPRVWFNNRTQATERVNALASGGMDDIDIPAFLRRQAD